MFICTQAFNSFEQFEYIKLTSYVICENIRKNKSHWQVYSFAKRPQYAKYCANYFLCIYK